MLNTSFAFRRQVAQNTKLLAKATLTLADGTVRELVGDDIMMGTAAIHDAVSPSGRFDVGAAIMNRFTLTLNNWDERFDAYDFSDATIVPYVGATLPDGTTEWLRKGLFHVDQPESYGNSIGLESYDNMRLLEVAWPGMTFPATCERIVNAICTHCGVTLATPAFANRSTVISEADLEGATCTEVLSYVAQATGHWARFDAWGRLRLEWYPTDCYEGEDWLDGNADSADGGGMASYGTGGAYDGGGFGFRRYAHVHAITSATIITDDVVITGVRVTAQDRKVEDDDDLEGETYLYGSEGYVLEIPENPLVAYGTAQAIATQVGTRVVGMRFRPLRLSMVGDPALEAGDAVIVTDGRQRQYRSYVTSATFKVGAYESIACEAETPGRHRADGYSALTRAIVSLRNGVRREKSARQAALEDLAQTLSEASGLYVTPEVQQDGSTIYYAHDKPTIAESQVVIKLTSEALGLSTDGGRTYPYGLSVDGNAILNRIYAIGIDAGYINSGSLVIGDPSDPIFLADFDAKRVRIGGGSSGGSRTVGELLDAVDEGVVDVDVEFAQNQSTTTAPTDADTWTTTAPQRRSGWYIWQRVVKVHKDGTRIAAPATCISGRDGSTGTNAATIYLYKKSSTKPAGVGSQLEYTFETGELAGNLNGWSRGVPAGDDTCWVTVATAIGNGASDVIGADEWSDPVQLAAGGVDGLSQATIYLFKRSGTSSASVANEVLAAEATVSGEVAELTGDVSGEVFDLSAAAVEPPTSTLTYTFATGELAGDLNGWTRNVPQGDGVVWVTTATAISSEATDSIAASEWAVPAKLAEDGTSVAVARVEYAVSASGDSVPETGWVERVPTVAQGYWLWTRQTNSDGTEVVTKAYQGTDGEDGMSVAVRSSTKVGGVTTVVLESTDGTVSTLEIADGEDGDEGIPGADGYVHVAWANSPDGNEDFSTSESADKRYMGVYTDHTEADSQAPSDYSWSLIKGVDGSNGYNTATILLYRRATSQPTPPRSALTYTFSEHTLTPASELAGWSTAVPDGTAPCWVTAATATSTGATDTIAASEWVEPSKLVEHGAKGDKGDKGDRGDSAYAYAITANPSALVRGEGGDLTPASVTFSATRAQGSGAPAAYAGRIRIDEYDGTAWTTKYTSAADEASRAYAPTSTARLVRATLYLAGGTTTQLDTQTAPVIADGATGASGYNSATVMLFKRMDASAAVITNETLVAVAGVADETAEVNGSVSGEIFGLETIVVAPPRGTLTYAFATGELAGNLDGWSQAIPAGTEPCWAISAAAVSTGASDTIAPSEWSEAVKLVENGTAGDAGAPGANTATVALYRRSDSQPETPAYQLTYTFATGALSGALDGWSRSVPQTDGRPCWVTQAVAISTGGTDLLQPGEWVTPTKMAEDGADGYTVMLANESHTFAATSTAAIAGSTTSRVIAYSGTDPVAATIGTVTGAPAGMTVSVTGNGTTEATLAVSVTTALTTRQGVLTVPVTVDGFSFSLTFSWSLNLQGEAGADGLNQATLYLYKRAKAEPARSTLPGNNCTYDFASGALAGNLNGWSRDMPETDGNPCWVISSVAISSGGTDTIATSDWSDPTKMVEDGRGIASTEVRYAASPSGDSVPASGWQAAIPSVEPGQWLWVRTVDTYTDNSTTTTYSKSYQGTDGADGTSVSIVRSSKEGDTSTVVISDGTQEKTLIIKDGSDGDTGAPGADAYTHIAYATSADGSQGFSTSESAGKSYMGVYADHTRADSQRYQDYSWSLIKGADGSNGSSTAVVMLYRRSAAGMRIVGDVLEADEGTVSGEVLTVPATVSGEVVEASLASLTPPTATLTYTFETGELAGNLGGWSRRVPEGREPCWVIMATATSTGPTDTITSGEWTEAARLADNGTSVYVSRIDYAVSITETQPTTGWSSAQPASVAEGAWLWVRTSYSDGTMAYTRSKQGESGTSTYTHIRYSASPDGNPMVATPTESTPYIGIHVGNSPTAPDSYGAYTWSRYAGADGVNSATVTLYRRGATAPQVPQATLTYTFATAALSGNLNGWSRDVPTGNDPCWLISAAAVSAGAADTITRAEWSSPVKYAANATNKATVRLYKRSASSPEPPAVALTYAFATGALSNGSLNGWAQSIPATDGNPCWVTQAVAVSTGDSDTIAASEWVKPAKMVEDGYNQATIYLYTRGASTPENPRSAVTYTFATGALSSTPAGWSRTVPSGTSPLWVITAVALSTTATDSIAASNWSNPVKIAENGANGTGIKSVEEQYYLSTSNKQCTGGTWTATQPTWVAGRYIWVRTKTVWDDGKDTTTYTDPVLAAAINSANENAKDAKDAVNTLDSNLHGEEIFNRLTNNGTVDALEWESGQLYINGTYIKGRTIAADKLVAQTITANEIASNAITSDKIAANAVTAAKIDTGAVTIGKLDSTVQWKLNREVTYRGVCSSGATSSAKVATCESFTLATGVAITVYNSTSQTYAGALSLGVMGPNDSLYTPYSVYVGGVATSSSNQLLWEAGSTITFVYTGGHWEVADSPGTWDGGSCSALSGTAEKTADAGQCVIFKGAAVKVRMSQDNNSTSATLNVSSLGAKAIYFGGGTYRPTKDNGYSWKAPSIVEFVFDGQYWRTGTRTYINGGDIIAGTISTTLLDAATIQANIVKTCELSASQITSGTISTERLNVSAISAKVINALEITGDKIHGGTIDGVTIKSTSGSKSTIMKDSEIEFRTNGSLTGYIEHYNGVGISISSNGGSTGKVNVSQGLVSLGAGSRSLTLTTDGLHIGSGGGALRAGYSGTINGAQFVSGICVGHG